MNHEEKSVKQTLKDSGFDSIEEVMRRSLLGRMNGVPACCTCGSYVEPGGVCPHGHESVLRKKGLV